MKLLGVQILLGVVLVILSFFLWVPSKVSKASSNIGSVVPTCNTDQLAQLENNFQRMVSARANSPQAFSDEAYKAAALNYIAKSEDCYHATISTNIPVGGHAHSDPITIDEGGLSPYENKITPFYNTDGGLKWGANSPYFPNGQNKPGPGVAGGTVTYSYMANGINHSQEEPGISNNTDVRTGLGVNGCIKTEIDTAFAAWSAVADIRFVEVADSGAASGAPHATGDIRIGAHPFDGDSGTLAHAFFPPVTGDTYFSISGDLHFDSGDSWSCTTGGFSTDIGLVALHEIGHSIGLDHEPGSSNVAVMNPFYDPSITVLQPDDINGAESIYGATASVLTAGHSSNPFPILATTTEITFSLHIYNSGGKTATNVVITNTIPASTTYIANTASDSGSENSGVIVWPATTVSGNSSIMRSFRVSVTEVITDDDKLINVLSLTSAEDVDIINQQLISLINPELVFLPIIIK